MIKINKMKSMGLNTGKQNSESQIVASRGLLHEASLFFESLFNHKLLHALGAQNGSEELSYVNSFDSLGRLQALKEGKIALSDIWHFIDFGMFVHHQSNNEYKLFNKNYREEGISLVNIFNISNLIELKIDFVGFSEIIHSQVCRYTHIDNNTIVNLDNNLPYILIEQNGVIIGHIKLKGQKTFMSYVNSRDAHGNISLVKGGIYGISYKYSDLLDHRISDMDTYNYIFKTQDLSLNFRDISKFGDFSKKLSEHIQRISKKQNIYIK